MRINALNEFLLASDFNIGERLIPGKRYISLPTLSLGNMKFLHGDLVLLFIWIEDYAITLI